MASLGNKLLGLLRSALGLSSRPNAQLSLQQLWPHLLGYAKAYGADPMVLAAIVQQESSFKNHLVHRDGTGHGLIGLDDNGLLPDFEKWSGLSVGRGHGARSIPPAKQLEYLAKVIGDYTKKLGDPYAAARAWHRGVGGMNDGRGVSYQKLIEGHVRTLFPNGRLPSGAAAKVDVPERDNGWQPKSGGPTFEHRVQSGDTLWALASRLKAQGMSGSHWDVIHQIMALNPQIKDPNLIYTGDTLKLPQVGMSGASAFVSSGSRAGSAGGVDAASFASAGELSKSILERATRIGNEINRTGGYRFDGYNDCYGFVRRVWDSLLKSKGMKALPVSDVGSSAWQRIDWKKLKVGDVLSTHQGHAWGKHWHGGIFAGFRNGVPYIYDNSGSRSAQLRPLPHNGYFSYFYTPVHELLS